MRLVGVFVACCGLILAGTAAAGVTGSWKGRLIDPREQIPSSAYPTGTLAVGASTATARFAGHTQAAHDSPSATSSCSMTFRYWKTADGWRYYAETGRPVLLSGSTSGGMPDLSMCSFTAIKGGSEIRIRPAGAKLRVEFTSFKRATWEGAELQGYLTR